MSQSTSPLKLIQQRNNNTIRAAFKMADLTIQLGTLDVVTENPDE